MRARSPKTYCFLKTTLAWIISRFYKGVPLYMLRSTQTSVSFGNCILIDQVWVVWDTKVEGVWKKNEMKKRLTYCCQSLESWAARKSVCILCVCVCGRDRAAQLVECCTEKHGTIQMWISQCNKGLSQSQLSVQTLLRCSHCHCVQSHASTFVFTLISQALADMLVFGHRKNALTCRNG